MKAQKPGKAKVVPVGAPSTEAKEKGRKAQAKANENASLNVPTQITHQMIAQRARSIWISKGRVSGQDEAIWYQAEMEPNTERKTE